MTPDQKPEFGAAHGMPKPCSKCNEPTRGRWNGFPMCYQCYAFGVTAHDPKPPVTPDQKELALLPCMCGKQPYIRHYANKYYIVSCKDEACKNTRSVYHAFKSEAVRTWNERATPPAPQRLAATGQEEVEELEKQVERYEGCFCSMCRSVILAGGQRDDAGCDNCNLQRQSEEIAALRAQVKRMKECGDEMASNYTMFTRMPHQQQHWYQLAHDSSIARWQAASSEKGES